MKRKPRGRPAVVLAVVAMLAGPAAAQSPDADRMTAYERQDLGVTAPKTLHAGAMHGPTPSSIPGGQVVTTPGLVALAREGRVPFVVFDALGQPETLPNAVPAAWLSQPGSFDDATQTQAVALFAQATQGRKDVALVFYCLSRECWMSYNAALRAIRAGYANVLWYRGGIEAWKSAGLPTRTGATPKAGPPAGFTVVEPVRSATPTPRPSELRIARSRFFAYAMPEGWRVGEDGQFALTLVAPDNGAMTVMVGNAGVPVNTPPDRFALQKLAAIQPQDLRMANARAAQPASGFRQAAAYDVAYVWRGVPFRGTVKVSWTPAYDTSTMAMTAAMSAADRWPGYATWLPQVADQVAAVDGAAFGMRGVMAQNLQNSTAYAQAARDYRAWSQQNWQQVVDQRNASQDKRNFAVRENLGGVQTFANPYTSSKSVELPLTNKYYWADRDGRVMGTDDPSADPNAGSTGEWRRMTRVNP